ncbi:MAG: alpha/beta hydrolase [Lachnospiraceae bacterium]|nr:alpha/beta hydrolase [Lachnospiraceae bacterium]
MLSKPVKTILHALSYGGVEVEASRRLADIKKLDPIRIFCRKLDAEIYNEEYKVPIRLYFPSQEAMDTVTVAGTEAEAESVLLFFHGGGWVTESVENYDRVCARMAQSTGCLVISVEYRLAPEYHFPVGLHDCYAAAKALSGGEIFPELDPEKITVIGDSAGGNLAAAVSMMARDTGEFQVHQQILIYPAVSNCYTKESEYPSVRENGEGYLLTTKKLEDYLNLYQSSPSDRLNPYFAPILADNFQNLPRTLILTAQYDPLRDEGEAYGEKLKAAGNPVEIHRIPDALHGYFALGIKFLHVQESFEYINHFLTR